MGRKEGTPYRVKYPVAHPIKKDINIQVVDIVVSDKECFANLFSLIICKSEWPLG